MLQLRPKLLRRVLRAGNLVCRVPDLPWPSTLLRGEELRTSYRSRLVVKAGIYEVCQHCPSARYRTFDTSVETVSSP